jgi:hypothetical protein
VGLFCSISNSLFFKSFSELVDIAAQLHEKIDGFFF